jgi:GxxExxY protein
MADLVYPELSYKIVGVLFEVHNRLGGSFEEKYYQRAIEQLLRKYKIGYIRELNVDISFEGDKIGKYFLDFLIDDKIVLELKAVPKFLPVHYRQIRSYLKVKNLALGILANFRGERLQYRRILSPNQGVIRIN